MNIVDQFHENYYHSGAWVNTFWLGVEVHKCPLDLWNYQEIIFSCRPDLIIECGTHVGGSAFFLASCCDLVGSGRVVTVEINPQGHPIAPAAARHPRIEFLVGDSIAPETIAAMASRVKTTDQVMVVLDSGHSQEHVLAELRAYGPLVTPGQYLIVEDGNVNGHPVLPEYGPGPLEAVEEFLAGSKGFAIDSSREKFLLTFNPRGYLQRR